MGTLWLALLIASLGSYCLKLAGLSLPQGVLRDPTVKRVAAYLPVAMLAALTAVQLFGRSHHYGANAATLAGVAAGVVAMLMRRSLLVVFIAAIAVTALLRFAF